MTTAFTLPKWYDLHTHFRQDATLKATVLDHVAMASAGALAMPNTMPPVGTVFESDASQRYLSVEGYREEIIAAANGAFDEVIVPLYLTADTTPDMIEKGAASGLLKACKYYPPHGTTGADHASPLEGFIKNGVFTAMEEAGVTLCIHGEEHGLDGDRYFDRGENAEEIFYRERMPRLIDSFPSLRMVGEHLTTKVGVDLITAAPAHVMANITPQHLLYTVGNLVKGLKYHLYCLPLVKFVEDRDALRSAATDPNNSKFFAGTDSAPHTKKTTDCGCAAGCYTGGISPQLYAMAFEAAGVDMSSPIGQQAFKRFLCDIGPEFYGLNAPQDSFTLENAPKSVSTLNIDGETITPLSLGMDLDLTWRIKRD